MKDVNKRLEFRLRIWRSIIITIFNQRFNFLQRSIILYGLLYLRLFNLNLLLFLLLRILLNIYFRRRCLSLLRQFSKYLLLAKWNSLTFELNLQIFITNPTYFLLDDRIIQRVSQSFLKLLLLQWNTQVFIYFVQVYCNLRHSIEQYRSIISIHY
jgi:hypothetical protein